MKSVGTFSVRKTTFVSTHVFEKWNAWEIHKFLFCANFSDPEKPLNISKRWNEIFNRSKYWPFAVNRRNGITDICTLKCDNQCFFIIHSSHQIQPEHWNEMRYQKRIFSRSFFPGFLFEYIWRCQFSLIEIYSIARSTCVRAGKKCSGCIWFALKYHNLTRFFFHFDAKNVCSLFILAERYSSLNDFISSIFIWRRFFTWRTFEQFEILWNHLNTICSFRRKNLCWMHLKRS